jgi:hypothetical protein
MARQEESARMRGVRSAPFLVLLPAVCVAAACSTPEDRPPAAQTGSSLTDGGSGVRDSSTDGDASQGDSGAATVACPVDPAGIYVTGYLAGGPGGGNAVAAVGSPATFCTALKGVPPVVRPTDKALLYLDDKKDVRLFQATSLVQLGGGKWGFDTNHVDPLVTSPCGTGATSDIWVRPTGEILFSCAGTFKWADGTAFDTGGLYPRALSATQALLVDTNNGNHIKVKSFTGELSPELSLGTKLWAYARVNTDGFDVVTYDVADADGSQAHELWHATITAVTKVGDYVPKPADAPTGRLATNVVLDSNRMLYEEFAGFGVWQRPLSTGSASVIYKVPTGGTFDWSTNPPKTTLVVNGLFTGP